MNNPQQSDNPVEQALGKCGREKTLFNRKKLLADPGSGRDSHLLQPIGGEVKGSPTPLCLLAVEAF